MSVKYVNFRWALTGEFQEMEVLHDRVLARHVASEAHPPTGEGLVDLGGRYLLPKFVDAHCHILPTGRDLKKLHLGSASSHQEVLDAVRDRYDVCSDDWLLAVHYNQTRYEGGRHLTRWDLDRISATRPIVLEHVNGHASVANSAALAAAGIGEDTPDPAGGEYRRGDDGRHDGVCLERAHEHVQQSAPVGSVEDMARDIVAAGEKMAEVGIGCASDMSTGFYDIEKELEAYILAVKMGCPIHMRLYVLWRDVFGPRALAEGRLKELMEEAEATGRLRVQGIKIFSDGGISSATAAIYGRYLTTGSPGDGPGDGPVTDGKLIYRPEKLRSMVKTASDAGWQVAIHAIGDYATDLVLDAVEATGDPARHRIEHAMILSDAQIERFARLGSFCAFQPEFLMALGPAYRLQLGDERAAKLIRSRSAFDAGLPISFNSDRPIVAGDPWDGILTASNRPAPFDPSENCTREEAILAYTGGGAEVNGDEDSMGTLLPGTFAHFQLYDEDPMTSLRPAAIIS